MIDDESINIYRELGEGEEPIQVVYWHEDEWIEDPELVLPAIVKAIDLFYTNQTALLIELGLNDLILT